MIHKKLLLASLALASSGIAAHAALTDGLVVYYDFQDSASGDGAAILNKAQSVGSNYGGSFVNGSILGTSVTSGFSGDAAFNSTGATGAGNVSDRSTLISGNAANFTHNGTDAIRTGVASSALGTSYTLSARFYAAIDPNQASGRYFVFEDGTNTTQFNVSYGSQTAASTATSLAMWSYNTGVNSVAVQSSVTVGAWHQVTQVFTQNGANTDLTVFIDGLKLNATPYSVIGSPTFSDLNIGNNRDSGSRGWDGMIDDVAIWNRALSDSEAAQFYSVAAVPEPSTYGLLGAGAIASIAFVRRRRLAK